MYEGFSSYPSGFLCFVARLKIVKLNLIQLVPEIPDLYFKEADVECNLPANCLTINCIYLYFSPAPDMSQHVTDSTLVSFFNDSRVMKIQSRTQFPEIFRFCLCSMVIEFNWFSGRDSIKKGKGCYPFKLFCNVLWPSFTGGTSSLAYVLQTAMTGRQASCPC